MAQAVQLVGDDIVLLSLYSIQKQAEITSSAWDGDELKIAITAPPVDGKANAHLAKYLAKQFKVAKSGVCIEKGELGRHKTIRITSPAQIPSEIQTLILSN